MSLKITPEFIETWRINYGLDKRSPEDAARWWSDKYDGLAPAGAVAAFGYLLEARDADLRAKSTKPQWQGLTDEEINAGMDRAVLPVEMRQAFGAGVRWAEAGFSSVDFQKSSVDYRPNQRGTVLDTADMEWDQESTDWMRYHFVGVEP